MGFSSCKDKTKEFDVVYEVELVSLWSENTHPTDFPSSPHMSKIVGFSHVTGYNHYSNGSFASVGIKEMAEQGKVLKLKNEFEDLKDDGTCLDILSGSELAFDSPGTSNVATIGMDNEHTSVTMVSMIAPSPDWFVGINASLKDGSGSWIDELDVPVNTYDSGTDAGTSFSSSNNAESPFKVVSFITDGPLAEGSDTVVNMGYFRFKRIK